MYNDAFTDLTIFVFGAVFGAALVRVFDHVCDIITAKRLDAAERGKKGKK